MILLLLLIVIVSACTTAEKIKCVAAAMGCDTLCLCDFPTCECCPACLACVTATAAVCCDCLFPGWSGCQFRQNQTISSAQESCTNVKCLSGSASVCCPTDQWASCSCMERGPHCGCKLTANPNFDAEACASAQCQYSSGQICCLAGQEATCNCMTGYANCGCI
jgi:hypothetical protein